MGFVPQFLRRAGGKNSRRRNCANWMSKWSGSKPCGSWWIAYANASARICLTAGGLPGWLCGPLRNEICARVSQAPSRRSRRQGLLVPISADQRRQKGVRLDSQVSTEYLSSRIRGRIGTVGRKLGAGRPLIVKLPASGPRGTLQACAAKSFHELSIDSIQRPTAKRISIQVASDNFWIRAL